MKLLLFLASISIASVAKADEPVETQEPEPDHGAFCPSRCFNGGLAWAKNRAAFLSVDVDRQSSCKGNGSTTTINWASLDRTEWPQALDPNYEGIPYTMLTATYDHRANVYKCGRDDSMIALRPAQARVCKEILDAACKRVDDSVCPCYSLKDLFHLEDRIRKDEIDIKKDKTCDVNHSPYGIFQKGNMMARAEIQEGDDEREWEYDNPADSYSFIYALAGNSCYFQGDIAAHLETNAQRMHCQTLMSDSCQVLKKDSVSQLPKCSDDQEYRFNGKNEKSCGWVAEKDTYKRCNRKDENGMRVFQYCKKTCNKCSCEDDPDFFVGSQKHKTCAWANAKRTKKRCKAEGVAENCLHTCSSKCCENKPDFTFYYKNKRRSGCDFVDDGGRKSEESYKKRNELCKRKYIASNCPDACQLCPDKVYIQ